MSAHPGIHIRPVLIPHAGDSLRADLLLPRRPAPTRPPVVLMAQDCGGGIRTALPAHAWHFARHGMAVLVFEHARLGDCGPRPEQWLDTDAQLADYAAAMAWLADCPEVDGGRLALWGDRLGGGHVLVTAARRPGPVCAVVAQQPHVQGSFRGWTFPRRLRAGALWGVPFDVLAAAPSQPQPCIPVLPRRGPHPVQPGTCGGRCRPAVPAGLTPINCVPARIRLMSENYRPLRELERVKCPVLLLAAGADGAAAGALRKAAERLRDCRLEWLADDAADLCRQVALQADFLCRALGLPPPAPARRPRRRRSPREADAMARAS